MILKCRCANSFQDKQYGDQLRVHNRTKKGDGSVHRCTVCGDEKGASGEAVAPGKKGKKS